MSSPSSVPLDGSYISVWIGWLAGSHSPQRSRPFPPSHRFSSYSCSLLPSTLVQVASQLVATILLHCRRWVFFLEIFPPPPPSSRRRVCRRYGLKITPNDLICHRVPVPLNVPLWIYYRVIGLSVFGSGNQAKDHAAERCSVLPFFFFAIVTIGGGGYFEGSLFCGCSYMVHLSGDTSRDRYWNTRSSALISTRGGNLFNGGG